MPSLAFFYGHLSHSNERCFSIDFPLQTRRTVPDSQQPASIINNFCLLNVTLPGKGKAGKQTAPVLPTGISFPTQRTEPPARQGAQSCPDAQQGLSVKNQPATRICPPIAATPGQWKKPGENFPSVKVSGKLLNHSGGQESACLGEGKVNVSWREY